MSKEFIWTDELVRELGEWYHDTYGKDLKYWGPEVVDAFKQSKAPKTYEILTFRYTPNGALYTKANTSFNEAFCLSKPDCYQIHSVRRLSDGEVFTVGDKLDGRIDEDLFIKAIWLNYNGNQVWLSTNADSRYGCALSVADKARLPLFTTVDGKEIFKGDTFYEVSTERWDVMAESEPHQPPYDQYYKYFSTQFAARDYVRRHKPCLSFADIEKIALAVREENSTVTELVTTREKLKALVDQKLQS